MAQACNNIGKDLSSSGLVSSSKQRTVLSSPIPLKSRKSTSPPQMKKAFKRSASPLPTVTKKFAVHPTTAPPLSCFPPAPLIFDSLFLHQLSKTFYSSSSAGNAFAHSSNSPFSPSSHRSPYLVDSLLAPPASFVCNWMASPLSAGGFCGQRFSNHYSLLEHLCTAHTSSPLVKSSPFFGSTSSVSRL